MYKQCFNLFKQCISLHHIGILIIAMSIKS